MADSAQHFPDVDEFVWLMETGDLNRQWDVGGHRQAAPMAGSLLVRQTPIRS
jgi:hypothetical protein